jgi:ABC-2 type transport system ATP-binding protein
LFALIGPDGAGKTTLLRLLSGTLKPDSGTARLLGEDLTGRNPAVKMQLGYMPQRFSIYADLTVKENLTFYADFYGLGRLARSERIPTLIQFIRLEGFENFLARNLSGGMRQKLALGCALVHSPSILLLDEPTTGIDPVSRREFWQLFLGLLGEGKTILFTTVYVEEAMRARRVGFLSRGTLKACAEPEALLQAVRGRKFFIRASPSPDALSVLKQLDGIQSVQTQVGGFSVLVSQPPIDLKKLLLRAGLRPEGIQPIPPNLEDVFITVAGN